MLLADLLKRRTTAQFETSDSPPCHAETDWPNDIAQVHRAVISIKRRMVTQLSAAVSMRDEVCAYLITWEAYGTMSELDFTVLAHACTAIGLEVLKRRAVTEAERKLHQGFYSAALSGEILSMDDATHRAHQARIELAPQYVVAAVASGRPLPEGALREIQRWTGSVAVQHDGSVVIILQVPVSHRSAVDGAEQILDRVMSRAGTTRFRTSIGMSQVVDGILELPAALSQARIALSVAEHLVDCRQPLRFDQLGIFKLLSTLQESPALAHYLHETIGPLLCARGSDDLLVTLETYLDNGCSHQGAARILEIHPNSVKYRIARVRQLLGDDALQNPIQRLGLHVALKARHVSSTTTVARKPIAPKPESH